jgi:diguanylate cyclase (GGDEF)-like protein
VVALPSLRVVAHNAPALRLLGLDEDALRATRADHLLATPEDLAWWEQAQAGEAPPPLLSDTLAQGPGGEAMHLRRSIRPFALPGAGTAQHCLVTAQDIGEARRAQHALESSADAILVTDLAGRVRAFNRRFAQLWRIPEDLLDARHDDAVQAWMRRQVQDPEAYQRRLGALREATLLACTDRLLLLDGTVVERIARPLWSRGRPLGRVWCFRDLSERIAADERIETLVRTDPLTGLPNRHRLAEAVDHAALAIRHDGDAFALLVLDLDRFSRVNDSLGHEQGDRTLKEVAERLRRILRADDLVARIGGDQFALLLRHADAEAAEAAAARALQAVSQPWQQDGTEFSLTCSVGIALAPGHGRSADELLRHAEAAMREAKRGGSNALRFHRQHAAGDLRSHMRLDHAMRLALAAQRFRLQYQPQVELASGRVVGAEALIRWNDPALGEVSPRTFIPVAEDTGFIVAIGDWVLDQAARQAAQWLRAGLPMPVAVNVSALQFRQPHFVDRVAEVLRDRQLPPEMLELELTETFLVHDADEALERLRALAGLGVRLTIDDFGTGYSSMAYLKRLPIHRLKIDRSYVQGLPGDLRDAGIVRAVLQIARALDMQVIAEGVETEPQRQFLASLGCDQFQGWLFAPALDALSFVTRIAPTLTQR